MPLTEAIKSLGKIAKKDITNSVIQGNHAGDALRYALHNAQIKFPNISMIEKMHRSTIPPMPRMSFTLNEINKKNLEKIMQGFTEEKELRNWEFGISHPNMINLEEITDNISRENPFIVVQSFRKEKYAETIMVGKGKNRKEITKIRTIPASDEVAILLHESLVTKARIIGHNLIKYVQETDMLNVYLISAKKEDVERFVKYAKEVKHAPFGDKADNQFVRVMVRKI